MSIDFPTLREIEDDAYRFTSEDLDADIHAAREYANLRYRGLDRQRFVSSFWRITVNRAAFESDVERIWSDKKRY